MGNLTVPLDEVVHFDAVTHSPTTGAISDADSSPAWAVYEEDTDTAIQSGSFTKRTSLTGNYRASFTASAANGFEVGKYYSVIASATVGGVAAKAVALSFRCSAAEASAGKSPVTLASGDVSGNLASDVQTIKTQTVTCAAGVTVAPYVGNATAAIAVDGSGFVTYANASPPTAAVIADAVWDEATTGHIDAGKAGAQLWTVLNTVAVDVAGLDGAAMRGTDNAYTGTPPTAAAIADAVLDEAGAGHTGLIPTNLDAAVSTRSTYAGGAVASVTAAVTVGTNNDKTGYSLTQAFPTNFAALGINASGHVSRVTLVDTTTTNTDMRGTDSAALASVCTEVRLARLDENVSAAKTLTAAERNSVADALLGRSVANIEATAAEWSLCTIVLAALESSISGTTWTIKRTNGSTTHATKTVTTDADANPITGIS